MRTRKYLCSLSFGGCKVITLLLRSRISPVHLAELYLEWCTRVLLSCWLPASLEHRWSWEVLHHEVGKWAIPQLQWQVALTPSLPKVLPKDSPAKKLRCFRKMYFILVWAVKGKFRNPLAYFVLQICFYSRSQSVWAQAALKIIHIPVRCPVQLLAVNITCSCL